MVAIVHWLRIVGILVQIPAITTVPCPHLNNYLCSFTLFRKKLSFLNTPSITKYKKNFSRISFLVFSQGFPNKSFTKKVAICWLMITEFYPQGATIPHCYILCCYGGRRVLAEVGQTTQ